MPFYIKAALDVLVSAPVCPICKKKMKPYSAGGFFECFQMVTDVVTGGDIKFICLGMVKNPKYSAWSAKMAEYQKKMQERDKIIQENERRLIFKKKVPPMPKMPPHAPAMIPCVNHYKKKCTGGEFNEKISKRSGGPKYISAGGVPVEYKF